MLSKSSWISMPSRARGTAFLLAPFWATLTLVILAWSLLVDATAFSQDGVLQEPVAEDKAQAADTEEPGALAALVPVRLPIVGNADQSLQQTLLRVRDQLLAEARSQGSADRPALVLRFETRDGDAVQGAGSLFERSFSLARFLTSRDMAEVKTIAYVPQTIRGHAVLPVIACEEIIMDPEAEIGDAGADEPGIQQQGGVTPTVRAAYQEIAELRNNIPLALVVAMLDPSAEVIQVESEDGGRFLLEEDLSPFREENEVINEEVIVAPGAMARFSGREGRQFGFVRLFATDLPSVARALDVPLAALQEDRSLMGDWRPILLEIRGPITPSVASQLETLIGRELKRGANWIGLRIESSGGNAVASTALANVLGRLDGSVLTVAYVPAEARGGAALVALACDRLVMHPEATLASAESQAPAPQADRPARELPPNPFDDAEQPAEGDSLNAALVSVRTLAELRGKSWSLLSATLDPSIEIYEYTNKQTGQLRLMSAAETAERPDSVDWRRAAAPLVKGGSLRLSGVVAQQKGVASQTVENSDQLWQLYGLDHEPALVETNWALQLIEALASPALATLLVMIGIAGLYIEVKTPGVGIGAFVAAVAFLLFFWSKSLDQTAGWLEALLFITGLLFILIEVFVLPGFGIFGLGGGALVIFSLVLASQTFVIPRTQLQMGELRRSLTVVAGAMIGVTALGMAFRRYLPNAPVFNRIMLEPPPLEERIEQAHREVLADYSHLVGLGGTARTDLRPTGKALIADELVDVVAEAEPLDRGTSIVVVSAKANRVVVRAVG
ncbi:NfeD family protein [Adhaeretor mobilis]|nr:hypothetical protein [Adhaeretor mobilis]